MKGVLRLLYLAVLLHAPGVVNAQIEYDINEYNVPDYSRHELEYRPYLSFSQYASDVDRAEGQWYQEYVRRSTEFSASNSFNYMLLMNTDRHVAKFSANSTLDLQGDYYASDENSHERINNTTTAKAALTLSVNEDYYFQDAWFIGVGGRLEAYAAHEWVGLKDYDDTGVMKGSKGLEHLNPAYNVALGYGRLHNMHDARQALYIFDALHDVGRLKKTPEKPVIQAFAELLTQLHNERYYDRRKHEIHAVTSIDSFLTHHGLVDSMDAVYYSHMYDMWQYGRNYSSRYRGYKLEVGYAETQLWRRDGSKMQDAGYISNMNIYYKTGVPLNNNWQFNASVFLQATGREEDEYQYSSNQLERQIAAAGADANMHAALGYFMNTRTSAELSYSYYYHLENSLYSVVDRYSAFDGDGTVEASSHSLQLSFLYYLSSRLQVNGSYRLSYEIEDLREEYDQPNSSDNFNFKDRVSQYDRFENDFSVRLTYDIF